MIRRAAAALLVCLLPLVAAACSTVGLRPDTAGWRARDDRLVWSASGFEVVATLDPDEGAAHPVQVTVVSARGEPCAVTVLRAGTSDGVQLGAWGVVDGNGAAVRSGEAVRLAPAAGLRVPVPAAAPPHADAPARGDRLHLRLAAADAPGAAHAGDLVVYDLWIDGPNGRVVCPLRFTVTRRDTTAGNVLTGAGVVLALPILLPVFLWKTLTGNLC